MKSLSIAIAAFAAATLALAAPPGKYADWAGGPVRHLMTAADREQWAAVSTEQEAQEFIDLFWARRDPSPATPENELRDEFDRRVELADVHFTTKRTRGAMTDRGRALILLGSPWQVGGRGPESRAPGLRDTPTMQDIDAGGGVVPVPGPRGQAALLTWTYAHDNRPAFVKRKVLEIMFVDDQGDGQWQFAKTRNTDPDAVMQQAAAALVFSPDLTRAPLFGAAPGQPGQFASFRTLALREACDRFREEGKPSEGPALLTWAQFVVPDGRSFTPVQLFLPRGSGIEAGRRLTLFGVVEDEEGTVVQVHEEPVTLLASRGDAYVDKSLTLPPGTWWATFGLADQGKVLSMVMARLEVDPLDPAASAISEMILSNNAFALPEAQKIGDPFAFGGYKVVPKADRSFSTADDIHFFYELRNPGLAKSGAPRIEAKIDITGKAANGQAVAMDFPLAEFPAVALPGVPGHFALALTFPLAKFRPGSYTAKVTVFDTVLGKSYASQKKFDVRG